MIETNLFLKQSKLGSSAHMAGLDFSAFNWKFFLIALLCLGIPNLLQEYVWKDELAVYDNQLKDIQQQRKKNNQKLQQVEVLKKQAEEYNKDLELLQSRMVIVQNIISKNRNPLDLFIYISKNIPEEVWIDEIKITDGHFLLSGKAAEENKVGVFFDSLKNSIFFSDKGIDIVEIRTENDNKSNQRFQVFRFDGQMGKWN